MPTASASPCVVVITGASSGLGAGFARRFASLGKDVVLIARRRELLDELARELQTRHGVTAHVVAADLADPAAPAAIVAALTDRGLVAAGLVNSAGFGTAGPFMNEDPARIADEIQVNVVALTVLTRLLLPQLIANRGILVQVSSNASHQPLPGIGVYAATKAYVTSLTEAIWQETRGTGLRVLALCPGPIATGFFEAAGSEAFKIGAVASVDDVLDVAFAELERADPGPVRTVGRLNRLQGAVARMSPRRLRLAVAARAVAGGA